MAVANITSIVLPGKFDPKMDKWENYREQLFFALEAAGSLEDAQKRALFLSQCGKDAFSLIVSLLSPRKASEVPFDTIISLLNKFFIPKPHPILETEKFYKRKQKKSERVTNFVAALLEIGSRCQFIDLDRRMGEQLVLGTCDETMRKELLKIKLEDMSYDAIVQVALNHEALQQNGNDNLQSNSLLISRDHRAVVEGTSVQKQCSSDVGEPMEVNAITSKPCVHCAKRHGTNRCRFRNATCCKCHKKGHTKAACDVNKQKLRVNDCCECTSSSEMEENTSADTEDNFGIHIVSGTTRVKPYMVDVFINGISVPMEVDSGSARTILPHKVYNQHKAKFPNQLNPCDSKLVTWTSDTLKIQGEMTVDVKYKGKLTKLPIVVSCGRGPALLGRNWFEALGISVQGIHSMNDRDYRNYIKEYSQLFDDNMDSYTGPLVHIEVKEDAKPVFMRARPVAFPMKEKVEKELKRMIADGILTPVKHARWATPLTIVPKSDGSLRLCGDYRSTVNASCVADSYPLRTANEAFFQLSGGKYFSKLDLKHAYNQLKVDEATAELQTLNTPLGLMKMNRLAYGVNAATGIFQRLMCNLLAGIDGVACLLDDVVISGETIEEHDNRLSAVLNKLSEVGLRLNKLKCKFAAPRVKFLGYEIDQEGIHLSKEKIQEIAEKPVPRDKRSLKAFLGLYNFYERFLKDKTVILQPLYRLLKDDVEWQWRKAEQKAFDQAKELLTSEHTLVHYSLEKEMIMICDASEYGVGAVLVHKMDDGSERPIIMSSRTLQEHERRYAQIDKEALAIMFGLKKFRQYLMGRSFVICTDHKPLVGIFGRGKPIPELISLRMLRWALTLNTFDYSIQYRAGKYMGNADSLSRWPTPYTEDECEEETEDIFLIESEINISAKEIAKETQKDEILRRVKFFLLHGWPDKVQESLLPYYRRREALSLSKECILWSNRVVIPKSMKDQVLNILHAGHSGVVQTKMLARSYIWYPSLDSDIENMITDCDACQHYRNDPPTTVHSWPQAKRPWSRVHMDFMCPFEGKTFFVMIDAYSKWPILEMINTLSSSTVINVLRKIFADYGLPEIIVSDNGLAFVSQEVQDFLRKNQVIHITGAPYHPSTNGQVERAIQTIKKKLKKLKGTWVERVAKTLFHMRTAPNTMTGKTPAELLNGRQYRTRLTLLHPELIGEKGLVPEEEEDEDSRKRKKLNKGTNVLFRVYNMNQRWQRGVIKQQLAPALYEVCGPDETVHRRHVDQIIQIRTPGDKQQYDYNDCRPDGPIVIPPPEEWPEIIGGGVV